MAKNQRVQIVSPKGTAVYPWLNRPDTKFSDDGEYKVTLKIPAEEAQDLIAKLDKMLEDYQAEQASKDPKVGRFTANTPYEEEMDDTGIKRETVTKMTRDQFKVFFRKLNKECL